MLSHEQPLTIRFEDADPAGIMFYPRTIARAHEVVEEMIRNSPLGWHAWFASPQHASPLRHAEADFRAPMYAGEKYIAQAQVERLGETSVTFLVEFHDQAHCLTARIRTVHVLIEKSTGRPVPLPEAMRQAFA